MWTRNLVTASIMALAFGLLTLSALALGEPALPVGPPDHDRTEACAGGVVSLHVWELEGGAQFMAYGQLVTRVAHGPVLVRYLVPPGTDSVMPETEVWLTMPGIEPERLTFAALSARYPQPCDLIRAVSGTGEPKTDL